MRSLSRLIAACVAVAVIGPGAVASTSINATATKSGAAATATKSGIGSAVSATDAAPATAPAAAGSAPAASPVARSAATSEPWKPRAEKYPNTVTRANLPIKLSDGVVLKSDLLLPADAAGAAIPGKFPVVVTITAYNKGFQQYAAGLAGGDPKYLVKRGYAQLTVDARGTGASGGQWCAFCTRENKDSTEIMDWAYAQSWSNGRTAMAGPSYMGINQIFAASGQPKGLKAIFPQVPAADVYRDVVASGGQLDVGFIPFWLGLVTVAGLVPPATPPKDLSPLTTLVEHLMGGAKFTLPLVLSGLGGTYAAYDGDFYKQRGPINFVSKVQVPTFLVSGEYDLFQRGTPLLFENLQKRGIPVRMILGPWNHIDASSGEEIGKAGLGTLEELKLRWFDHYVLGVPDPTLDSDIPPIRYYEQGTGAWKNASSWMGNRKAVSYRLSGTSKTGGTAGTLTKGTVTAGTSSVFPIPVAGLCTRSTDQWTAGVFSLFGNNPCMTNNSLNDKLGAVFRTAPLTSSLPVLGPINVRLFVSSNSGDGMLSVAVEDEAPDGKVSRLTAGWQVISHRALDTTKSRYLDGRLVQPYHPFTKAAQVKIPAGGVRPVDVEVFPTGARIKPGHRLRISVQAFDVPHLLPILPDLLSVLTIIKIHNSAQYPSLLTVPALKP